MGSQHYLILKVLHDLSILLTPYFPLYRVLRVMQDFSIHGVPQFHFHARAKAYEGPSFESGCCMERVASALADFVRV